MQISSIFLIGEEERNIITKVKIDHDELLNKPYTDFLSWLQNNNLLQSNMPGSDETTTHIILGVEIRLAATLNKKILYQPSKTAKKLCKQYIKSSLNLKLNYLYTNSIDIETFYQGGRFLPYCIVTFYKNKSYIFYGLDSIDNYFTWIKTYPITGIFYAHNLTFDGGILLEHGKQLAGININAILYKNNIYKLELTANNGNSKIIIKCSFKLLPLSLKKIGTLIGLEKLEFEHSNVTQRLILLDKTFKLKSIEYCTRDNEIIIHFIEIIKKHVDLKFLNKALSISSLALEIFKTNFNSKNVNLTIPASWDRLIRSAYYGGRCEVFGNAAPDEYIYHFDFYSMYSQIMEKNFCYGQLRLVYNPVSTKDPGFYNVNVISSIKEIPVLPYHSKTGKLFFPNGSWSGTYWFEELNYFQELGGVIEKINFKLEFEYYDCGLHQFTTHFLKKRNDSPFGNVFWKLFINSIAGRFGMQFLSETSIIVNRADYEKKAKLLNIVKELHINNVVILSFKNETTIDNVYSNVAIAAAITARGRIKLHKGLMSTIKNGGRILYTDTDSIFAAFTKNMDNVIHDEIFWDTTKSNTKITRAVFAIPKGYAIETQNTQIVKLRSFKQNSVSFKEFEEAFNNNKNIFSQELLIQKKNYILFLKLYEKHTLLSNYDKRIFNKNKQTTEPIIVINDVFINPK